MNLIISGKSQTIETNSDAITVSELLELVKVEMPQMVSVELNGDIVLRDEYSNTRIKNGDSVEFLYFMGGGI